MINALQIPRRFTPDCWGGTETVVLESSKALKALGHRSTVYTTTALTNEPRKYQRETVEGVGVHRFPYFYPYLGLSDSRRRSLDENGGNLFSWDLWKALRKREDFQLLHLHTGKRMGGIARSVALQKGLPYIVSLHGGLFCRPEVEKTRQQSKTAGTLEYGKALGWLVGSRKVLRDAAAVLCLTNAEKEELQRLEPSLPCRVVPNGVDLERFSRGSEPVSREKFTIGVFGRIDPQKNQILALEALARLDDPTFHLMLVGPVTDVEYGARVKRMIGEMGLSRQVTLVEGLKGPELVAAYHNLDLLLIPSVHEPFGIVTLEGWASQVPVVASRVGGLAELITHQEDGVLFPSGDAEHLATLLSQFSLQPGRLRALTQAGFRTVQDYSWYAHSKRLVEIYEEVIREYRVR